MKWVLKSHKQYSVSFGRGQTYNDDSNQENASGNEETQLRDEVFTENRYDILLVSFVNISISTCIEYV